MQQILIFTDLDGTLLDHHDYSFTAAQPSLEQIRRQDIPLILSSSKTAAELRVLRRRLESRHPCIVENGAAILFPENYFKRVSSGSSSPPDEKLSAYFFGSGYADLIDIVHQLRAKHRYRFTGFADFSVAEVAEATGLDQDSALLAKTRDGSEPIRWEDSLEALDRFRRDLAPHQLQLIKGGRFYHILPMVDKGEAVSWLIRRYRQCSPGTDFFTIALGDGLNDLPMLEKVDLAVVLPSACGDLVEPTGVRTMRMNEPGPIGWNRAINEVFNELQTEGEENE